MTNIRKSLFDLEIFEPCSGTGYGLDAMIIYSSDISLLPQTELLDELDKMETEGLIEKDGEYYRTTRNGQIAKQQYLSGSRQRNAVLVNQISYDLGDLILAIAVSKKVSIGDIEISIPREAFCIYLFEFPPEEVESCIDNLINSGYLEKDTYWTLRNEVRVTAQGLQIYQREVRQRLGLAPNEGLLDLADEALVDERFALLELDTSLISNLQHRWVEIESCANCGAYLAAVILLGSVLEGLLLARLQKEIKLAMTSSKAPRENQTGTTKKLNDWSLQDYIVVSIDLGLIPGSIEKHIHELRDTRNLVHPNKQISSNILVDESLYRISKEVAETIIDAILIK